VWRRRNAEAFKRKRTTCGCRNASTLTVRLTTSPRHRPLDHSRRHSGSRLRLTAGREMIALVYAKPCGCVNTLFRANVLALTLFSLPGKTAPVLALAGSVALRLPRSPPATDPRQGYQNTENQQFGYARPPAWIPTLPQVGFLTSLYFLTSEFIPASETFRKNSCSVLNVRDVDVGVASACNRTLIANG